LRRLRAASVEHEQCTPSAVLAAAATFAPAASQMAGVEGKLFEKSLFSFPPYPHIFLQKLFKTVSRRRSRRLETEVFCKNDAWSGVGGTLARM